MESKLMKKLLAILLCFNFLLFAEDQEEVAPESIIDEAALEEAYEALKSRDNISESLILLEDATKLDFEKIEISTLLLELLEDKSLLKVDLIAIMSFSTKKAIPLKLISPSDYYTELLALIKRTYSPTVLKIVIKQLLNAKKLKNGDLLTKINKFIGEVVLDASKKKSSQKYQEALHISCLKSLKAKSVKKDVLKGLLGMMKDINEKSPKMQIALFSAFKNLLRSHEKTALEDKKDKLNLYKYIEKFIVNSPSLKFPVSDLEMSALESSLKTMRYLIVEDSVQSYIAGLIKEIQKLLLHKESKIVQNASEILLNLSKVKKRKSPYYLHTELISIIKNKNTNKLNPANQYYFQKILAKIMSNMIRNKNKKEVDYITEIASFFYKTATTPGDLKINLVALDGLMVFDPSYFKSKIDSDQKKLFQKLLKDTIALFNTKGAKEKYPQLIAKLAEVLNEITGKDYGDDGARWNTWVTKEGKNYF